MFPFLHIGQKSDLKKAFVGQWDHTVRVGDPTQSYSCHLLVCLYFHALGCGVWPVSIACHPQSLAPAAAFPRDLLQADQGWLFKITRKLQLLDVR